ncbi:MAG TPA: tyrosine-type recombinase/integrase [Verrucomicrobiae bacterium]|jgi:integrase
MNVYQRFIAKGDHTYYGRFRFRGKQVLRNLGTEIKAVAEKRLRDIYKEFEAGRFAATEDSKLRRALATIGELAAAYRVAAQSRRLSPSTIEQNIGSLGVIIRKVQGAGVDPLAQCTTLLTPKLVQDYQSKLLTAAGADKLAQDRAATTANSTLRQARCLFGKKIRPLYTGLKLPDLGAFLAYPPLPCAKKRYQLPPAELIERTIRNATADVEHAGQKFPALKTSDPNAYRAFLLAIAAGERKAEIGHSRHSWIRKGDDGRYTMTITLSADFRTKGKVSRPIPLEDHVVHELEALRIRQLPGAEAEADGYILDGNKTERTELCFRRLNARMTALGWATEKKIHELRKYYGSLVAMRHGLYAAQKLLGHKDPKVTSDSYADLLNLPDVAILSAPAKAA